MFGLSSKDEDNQRAAEGVHFNTLRAANTARQHEWDVGGHADNDDWRINELMGEIGEVCNILKKLHRERVGIRGSRADKEMLADELADVLICLDLFLASKELRTPRRVASIAHQGVLTRHGRLLFSAVAKLDTLAYFGGEVGIVGAADVIYTHCLMLAEIEGIDIDLAVAKKFNETSHKMGLSTFLTR